MSQTGKDFGYSKVAALVLISHDRGMLIVIFRRKVAMRNSKS